MRLEVAALGIVRTLPGTCPCEVEAWERAEAERTRREGAAWLARRMRETMLPARLADATFQTFERRRGTDAMLAEARAYAERWPAQSASGEGMILRGPVGSGKSHLAAALVRHIAGCGGSAVFLEVPRFMVRVESSYSRRRGADAETEIDLLEAVAAADLVVLDDLAAERWTEKREERLFLVVDGRWAAKRPVVATTNALSPEDLEAAVGARTYDRLVGSCRFVETTATSYRRKEHRRLMAEVGGGG